MSTTSKYYNQQCVKLSSHRRSKIETNDYNIIYNDYSPIWNKNLNYSIYNSGIKSDVFEKEKLISNIIDKSKYILALKSDYLFDNTFVVIQKTTWDNVTNEIKLLLNKLDYNNIKNINFIIKPWFKWNIDFYIKKEWITMLINYNIDITKSRYSISYLVNSKIENHNWNYNRNCLIFDIHKL